MGGKEIKMKETFESIVDRFGNFLIGMFIVLSRCGGPAYGVYKAFINPSEIKTLHNVRILEKKYESGNDYLGPDFGFVPWERTTTWVEGYPKCMELGPFSINKNLFSPKRKVLAGDLAEKIEYVDSFEFPGRSPSDCDSVQKFYWKEGK
jgi:hypothetical protein